MRSPGPILRKLVKRHFDWRGKFMLTESEFKTRARRLLADASEYGYTELAEAKIAELETRWIKLPDRYEKETMMRKR